MNQSEKRKRAMERRTAAQKESTSVRLSENDRKIIDKKATAKGMNRSEYIRHMAVNGDDGCTPYQRALVQNLVNRAYETVKKYNPDEAKQIERAAKKLWE